MINRDIKKSDRASSPLVSIIIPIFKVAPFVRKTLESVAQQTYPNIETIIVNDATPDDSMVVVERAMDGVPNPKIINLETNGGLSNARNVGIQNASGDYIFFLDSDDWLAPEAMEKAVDKALLGDAQVVVVDFYKANHAHLSRAKDRSPYTGARYDVFDPRDEQTVLRVFNLAQIKLYNREFIVKNNFAFREGLIYEDIDWTFKIMTTARRVAIVNEPLYYYRTARPGSILTTKGMQHFDVLTQYEEVFEFLKETGRDEFLETIYSYAVNAVYSVLAIADRIPSGSKRKFFKRAQKMFQEARGDRTFKVTLYNRGKVDRVFLKGDFVVFQIWRSKPYQMAAKQYRKWSKPVRRKLSPYKQMVLRYLRQQHVKRPELLERVFGPAPKADIVFESYWGDQFSDSPKYLYQYIKTHHPEISCVYSLKGNVKADIKKEDRVTWNSHAYRVALLGAKVVINNNNFVADFVKQDDQLFIQTFHGIPLKKIGTDVIGYPDGGKQNWTALVERCKMWDYVVTSGAHHSETLRAAFHSNAKFIECGSPRTDCLQSQQFKEKWHQKIRQHYKLPEESRIILYAPTWRKTSENVLLMEEELSSLLSRVDDDVYVLYRNHHFAPAVSIKHPRVISATHYPDSQHLCAAADMLISDYSSIALDFAATGQPAFFYVPDYQEYEEARGLYVDMKDQLSAVTFDDLEDLLDACVDAMSDPEIAATKNAVLHDMFLEAENEDSCKYIVENLILPHVK